MGEAKAMQEAPDRPRAGTPTRPARDPARPRTPSQPLPDTSGWQAQLGNQGVARLVQTGSGLEALDPSGGLRAAFGRHGDVDLPVFVGSATDAELPGGRPGMVDDSGVFVTDTASSHVRAHEAAHAIQRRQGVPRGFPGGAEGHANAVADAAVDGRPIEPLLTSGGEAAPSHPQLYTVDDEERRISKNGRFIVADGRLWVKDGVELPRGFTRAVAEGGYAEVQPDEGLRQAFVADCLSYAEQVAVYMAGREKDLEDEEPEFEAAGTGGLLFGDEDEKNLEIANSEGWGQGHGATPGVADAYAICRTREQDYGQEEGDQLKFHVATVIAVDGGDRITAESSAPVDGDEEELAAPLFDMYGTEDQAQSFQSRHGETYAGEDGAMPTATGVLTLRDPPAPAQQAAKRQRGPK